VTLSNLSQYGSYFQTKVLSLLLTNKEFLLNIHDVLSEEYFENPATKWCVEEIMSYFVKFHAPPTLEVLKIELQKLENEVLKIAIKEQLKEACHVPESDLQYVQEEFSNFCKNQQLKKALLSSVDLLKAGDYDSIRAIVDNALRAGQDKNVGHEYHKDIESRFREDQRVPIATPWNQFNELLQGGLGNGDFGLVFGNPGGGKSWCLVALGGHAVELGYNVIHYTLELGEDYVGRRYDAFFTQTPVQEITKHKDKVEQTINQLPGQLIIKEYPTGRASISTVEAHIKKCIDLGFKPDLIIIDYVDLLSTRRKNADRKVEIDDIYISTKGLARELNIPIWSVSQVNRTGAKEDIVEGTSAAGSYDKIMITDVCISLSRKKEDKVGGTGRFHIMKNRYGMDGITYNASIDTSTGKFDVLNEYVKGEEPIPNSPQNIDQLDRKMLASKFFELNV
jgi:replicative DNA helicase